MVDSHPVFNTVTSSTTSTLSHQLQSSLPSSGYDMIYQNPHPLYPFSVYAPSTPSNTPCEYEHRSPPHYTNFSPSFTTGSTSSTNSNIPFEFPSIPTDTRSPGHSHYTTPWSFGHPSTLTVPTAEGPMRTMTPNGLVSVLGSGQFSHLESHSSRADTGRPTSALDRLQTWLQQPLPCYTNEAELRLRAKRETEQTTGEKEYYTDNACGSITETRASSHKPEGEFPNEYHLNNLNRNHPSESQELSKPVHFKDRNIPFDQTEEEEQTGIDELKPKVLTTDLPPKTDKRWRSRNAGHIKKPLNAFMLFMKEMRAQVIAECTLKESAAINQILGRRWHALTREAQAKYYDMAKREKELHQRMYPGWSARDNYATQVRRRNRAMRNSTTAMTTASVSGHHANSIHTVAADTLYASYHFASLCANSMGLMQNKRSTMDYAWNARSITDSVRLAETTMNGSNTQPHHQHHHPVQTINRYQQATAPLMDWTGNRTPGDFVGQESLTTNESSSSSDGSNNSTEWLKLQSSITTVPCGSVDHTLPPTLISTDVANLISSELPGRQAHVNYADDCDQPSFIPQTDHASYAFNIWQNPILNPAITHPTLAGMKSTQAVQTTVMNNAHNPHREDTVDHTTRHSPDYFCCDPISSSTFNNWPIGHGNLTDYATTCQPIEPLNRESTYGSHEEGGYQQMRNEFRKTYSQFDQPMLQHAVSYQAESLAMNSISHPELDVPTYSDLSANTIQEGASS